jgi:regulator of protease activity HflC (stomatin/prohibitin superfamily)
MQNKKLPWQTVLIAVIVIAALIVVFRSYKIIEPGYRGVVIMLGRVEETTLSEGFHLIIPPVARRVIPIDVRTKKIEVSAEAASSDLQILHVTGILNYHLDPTNVNKLYQEVGLNYSDIIIVPAMQEAIKSATAQFKVERILIERAEIKDIIQNTLRQRLGENHIVVDAFSLADVSFSDEFDAAIERKQIAEQAAIQKQYELQAAEKDVEIQLAKAEGDKKASVIAAEGRAQARKVEAEAEAEALDLIAQQLADNPALIQYEWATRLSPSIKTIMVPSGQDFIIDTDALIADN